MMLNRRSFLQKSGSIVLGGMALASEPLSFLENKMKHAIGLQLFTFFNDIDKDVEGTLQKVANIGYKEIESAFSRKGGFYGMTAKEFNTYLQSIGLSWKSHHVLGAPFQRPAGAKMPMGSDGKLMVIPQMKNLKDNMQSIVDEASEGGVKYLVCANTPINTLDQIQQSIETLNKTDEACKKAGLKFAYHNHDAEFHAVEGKIPYEMFLSQTPVKMELDIAWAVKGGKDPIQLFNENPGRFPLWHLKNLDATKENVLPVGEGIIDFKPIFKNAKKAGMEHLFVEHDMPKDAITSIKSSFDYLSKI